MTSNLITGVGIVYAGLVANFYYESGGFVKFYNEYYPLWKVTPVLFLAAFSAIYSQVAKKPDCLLLGVGLAFGALGDYLIGKTHDGIVTGAIAFGIGHLFFLKMMYRGTRIHYPSTLLILAWGAVVGHLCLTPLIAEHPIPVLILSVYSLVLISCASVAISQYIYKDKKATNNCALCKRAVGFVLFFISDSLLIFHHTGFKLPVPEFLILNIYYFAQFLIMWSFIISAPTQQVASRKKRN